MNLRFRQCEGCFKPVWRRLGNLQTKDDFECYGESYVKCFWGLCDRQKSVESFAPNSDGSVITEQPRRQAIPYNQTATAALVTKN